MTRINARIDDELAGKLERIREARRMTVTDIVRVALEEYSARFEAEHESRARDALHATAFVGCAEGEPSLSSRYKEALDRSLLAKS